MKWINVTLKTLPKEGVEVFFDGGENPPVWGKIIYNGKHPSILVHDSSGEEDYLSVFDYERWLDESSIENILVEALEDLIEAIPKQTNDHDWWEDSLTHAVDKAKALVDNNFNKSSASLPVTGESEAIGFAEWKENKYLRHGETGLWHTYDDWPQKTNPVTTTELYNLYKKSNPESEAIGERKFTLKEMREALCYTYNAGKTFPGNNRNKDEKQYFKDKFGIDI